MADYFLETEYEMITFAKEEVNFKEFEGCVFRNCNFSQCSFVAVTFIDCTFNDCIFTGAAINHVAFRTVFFNECAIVDVNFAMCDKLIFEVHFKNCRLDFSKFYTLKIKGTTFTDCSIVGVDFMSTDLTGVIFDSCDLYRSVFIDTVANKTDFKTSFNFSIDPKKNKIKKAVFSIQGLKGLLDKHEIIVE